MLLYDLTQCTFELLHNGNAPCFLLRWISWMATQLIWPRLSESIAQEFRKFWHKRGVMSICLRKATLPNNKLLVKLAL